MNVRAKFYIESVTEIRSQGSDWKAKSIKARPVMGEANKQWSEASPSGSLELMITNPKAYEQFQAGQFVYLDFSEAPEKD
jgi:hypothetical protein